MVLYTPIPVAKRKFANMVNEITMIADLNSLTIRIF
jgi:hypothetical protein